MTKSFYFKLRSKHAARLLLLALIVWSSPRVITAENDKDHEEAGHDEHEDIVRLTQAELDEFGIELSSAGPGTLRIEITTPGEIAVNDDKLAHIAPRFSGVVRQVNKRLGDQVKTGDVLAIVESNEGLVSYEIKSLLDGTIIEKHITIGEVRTEVVPAFVIANLDTVWVNLSIYQMHLPHIRVGQRVTISSGHDFTDTSGIISYLSPFVDERTRTATARVVLANYERKWRPGQFVEGRILVSEESVALRVPKSSVQKFEGGNVIFVRTSEGFKPEPVTIGRTDPVSVEILSGLEVGQMYVSKGGFTLKAELEKSSFSSGHSH
ncbi:MAG: efflux RND transporter periplasmic adaptor subunit [candidate division Zixibacteria bacterium]|nr:efflux RND transporter periplasmic adaptor subunit [candidate division Zixibacteria bacterium]